MSSVFSRRSTVFMIVSSPAILVGTNLSAAEPCDSFEFIQTLAHTERNLIRSGGFSVDHNAVKQKITEIQDASAALKVAVDANDLASRRAFLSQLNLAGGAVFALISLSAAAPTLPAIFLGSIFYSQAMIVATAITSPQATSVVDVVAGSTADRVAGVLQINGQKAYTVSPNLKTFSKVGGNLLSGVTLLYSLYSAIESGSEWWKSAQAVNEIKGNLDRLEVQMKALQDQQSINSLRLACANSIIATPKFTCISPPG